MSNAAHALDRIDRRLRPAATAIANARAGRRGDPPIAHVLDVLPNAVFAALVEDVRAALAALDARPPEPRAPGPLTAADAQVLRIERNARAVAIFAWPLGEVPVEVATAALGNRTAAGTLDPATGALVAAAANALTPSRPEPTP